MWTWAYRPCWAWNRVAGGSKATHASMAVAESRAGPLLGWIRTTTRGNMTKPIIGITSHALAGPVSHPSIGAVLRSGANQVYVDSVVAAGGAPLLIPLGLDGE